MLQPEFLGLARFPPLICHRFFARIDASWQHERSAKSSRPRDNSHSTAATETERLEARRRLPSRRRRHQVFVKVEAVGMRHVTSRIERRYDPHIGSYTNWHETSHQHTPHSDHLERKEAHITRTRTRITRRCANGLWLACAVWAPRRAARACN